MDLIQQDGLAAEVNFGLVALGDFGPDLGIGFAEFFGALEDAGLKEFELVFFLLCVFALELGKTFAQFAGEAIRFFAGPVRSAETG